jgi:hypothetical protein
MFGFDECREPGFSPRKLLSQPDHQIGGWCFSRGKPVVVV